MSIIIDEEDKDLIVKAAKEDRRSIMSFVIKSALDKAKQILGDEK